MKERVVNHSKGLLEVRTPRYIVHINADESDCKGVVSIVRVMERR